MEKTDARKHSPKTQFEIRKQVIRLRKQGVSNKMVAEGLGITERTASSIWQKYLKNGESSIKLGRRGRQKGEQRKLTAEQESGIKKAIIDKTPDQLKLPYALWTREAIQRLIKQQYELNIPLRTISDYLKRWGFSFQKPAKQAYEQKPLAIQKWLDEEYPAIKEQAKQKKAEIYWGDETGIQNDAYQARGFAPKGKTPVVRLNVNKSRVNMISAISNQGQVRFMLYEDTMKAERLIQFMSRLIKDANRKVYLILDNLRTHHSKDVKQWLEKNKDTIEVFYLPSYSPELNPDEYLNGNLKRQVHSGLPARTLRDLKKKTRSFMKTLQRRPHHVQNYFKHVRVAYAA